MKRHGLEFHSYLFKTGEIPEECVVDVAASGVLNISWRRPALSVEENTQGMQVSNILFTSQSY